MTDSADLTAIRTTLTADVPTAGPHHRGCCLSRARARPDAPAHVRRTDASHPNRTGGDHRRAGRDPGHLARRRRAVRAGPLGRALGWGGGDP
jgi:hypothetical protein